MKKTSIMVMAALLILAVFANAQTIHDPNSDLYRDIDRWSVQGYITEFLPMTRPYPMPLIDKILDQVIEHGDAQAQSRAAAYRDSLAPGARFIHPGVQAAFEGKNTQKSIIGNLFAEGAFRINDLLAGSYNFSIYGLTDTKGGAFNVPGTYSPYQDFVYDVSNIGPVQIAPDWTSLFSVGSSDVYFQGGLSRASYGPFYDNGIVVGQQAPKSGHFDFVFYQPKWSFEVLYLTISASDDFGNGIYSGKSAVFHTVNVRPIPALELGITQTLVWGGRTELLYLIPFTYLFQSQTIINFDDNALIGLYFRWKPFDTLLTKGQVYIDDFSFNGLFTGDMKIKAAGELGLSWAPKNSVLSKLDFDYTAVLPYTYTHWAIPDSYIYQVDPAKKGPNYENYSHLGKNLGPDLEPNSDRVSIRTSWNTLPQLDLNASAYLIRHANASAGKAGLDPVYNDGSLFDHGSLGPAGNYEKNPYIYAWYLTQDLIETRLGATLGAVWKIPTNYGIFSLTGEYGMEYGWNRSLKEGDNGLDHFWSIGGMWSW
ncbi:MAG: hypothetical protein FWD78_04335 [Treponema sp.]|nr:hypothetical protein [Treponema sp.]